MKIENKTTLKDFWAKDWHNKETILSPEDQRFILENLPLPKDDEERLKELDADNDVIAYENVSGTYKRNENSEKTLSKNDAIAKLKLLGYRTPKKEVAFCLEIIFKGWNTFPGYWLYVAQHYTTKTINSVISEIVKQHQRGDTTVKNPAKYFTYLLTRFHKPKKIFRSTIGTYKRKGDNNVIS